MVLVYLVGGLGNQLFQYATGKALATELNQPLQVSTALLHNRLLAYITNITPRKFALSTFGISPSDSPLFNYWLTLQAISPLYHNVIWLNEASINYSTYSMENLSQATDVVMWGYWQSETYFAKYDELIRNTFTFKKKLSTLSQSLLGTIRQQNSISLHVRRGDYVTNNNANKEHGVCGIDYYERAISYIENCLGNCIFYVFSDDIDWAVANLSILLKSRAIYVLNTPEREAWEDMYLMSQCTHHIIANSSFSWWGAWLNQNPEKIVIAPKKWYNSSEKATDSMIPLTWVRL